MSGTTTVIQNQVDYTEANRLYWERGYNAPSVDHPVFRFYGRILKPQFNLGGHFENLLDFGCGQGAAVNYFWAHGFNAKGVDISRTDIAVAQIRYPHIADNFTVCHPEPDKNSCYGFTEGIQVVTAIQSLYYLGDSDLEKCLKTLHGAMTPGAVIFATMLGEQSDDYYTNSSEYKDGLRSVNFKNSRYEVDSYYAAFTKDEKQLKEKFRLFKPIHIGYYSEKFREDEGTGFHYTFCGIKDE